MLLPKSLIIGQFTLISKLTAHYWNQIWYVVHILEEDRQYMRVCCLLMGLIIDIENFNYILRKFLIYLNVK